MANSARNSIDNNNSTMSDNLTPEILAITKASDKRINKFRLKISYNEHAVIAAARRLSDEPRRSILMDHLESLDYNLDQNLNQLDYKSKRRSSMPENIF